MNKLSAIPALIVASICIISCSNSSSNLKIPPDKKFTLNINNMTVIIDGKAGAKIISLKLDSQEILSSNKVNRGNYGSTLWLSPEGKWRGHGILDTSTYNVNLFNAVDLELKSRNDTLLGFAFTKKFHANLTDTSLVIQYTMTNISKDTIGVAPWEVTRVITGGLALIPKRSAQDFPTVNTRYPLPSLRDSIGIIWCPYDTSTAASQKLFMNGGEGWIAYVKDGVLFIKKFPVVKLGKAAPGEKNAELYVNKQKTYMELENQGEYQILNAGGSLSYEVKWYARRMPLNINVEIGNQDLLKYIRSVIRKE